MDFIAKNMAALISNIKALNLWFEKRFWCMLMHIKVIHWSDS